MGLPYVRSLPLIVMILRLSRLRTLLLLISSAAQVALEESWSCAQPVWRVQAAKSESALPAPPLKVSLMPS